MATTPTQNAVPSESRRDLKFNAGKFDEVISSMASQYIDRFGRAHYTVEGLKKLILDAIYNLGLNPVGTFQDGATLTAASDIIQDASTGIWYRWDDLASLPKVVPAGSTPESTGGTGTGKWLAVDVSDLLRKELAEIGGAAQIGAEFTDGQKTTVQEFLDANDSASYRDRNIRRLAQLDYVIQSRGAFKALFQGDSMTAGYDSTSTDITAAENGDYRTHATTTYPERFISYIQQQAGVLVTPVYRAISGYTAKQAYENPDWQENPDCDVAFLMYGLNDAGGVEGATHESYMQYMELLIRRFIDWGIGVVVLSCAAGGYGSTDQVAQSYARQIKNLSTVYGCAFFNANEAQYRRLFGAVQSDGTHFNSNGYARLGEALASMCMAGGLLPHYRPISSEITFWPGIQSDQVSYNDPGNSISLQRFPDFAYSLQKISGAFSVGQAGIMSFSFYYDGEAADVELIGSWTAGSKISFIIQQETSSQAGNNVPYYIPHNYSSNQADNAKEKKLAESLITSFNASGGPKYLGQLIGRGWRTITIFSALDNSATDGAVIQGITIRPIPEYLAQRQSAGSLRRGVKEAVMVSIPYRDFRPDGGGIPAAVSLSSIVLPLPQDLHPLSWDNGVNFFDCGPAKLTITGNSVSNGEGVVYYEALISKQTTGTGLTVTELKKIGTWGAITATIGTKSKKLLHAAGSVAPNMPIENMYVIGDDSSFVEGSTPNEFGLFIRLNFTYTGTAPAGYFNIEIESFARGLGGAGMTAVVGA